MLSITFPKQMVVLTLDYIHLRADLGNWRLGYSHWLWPGWPVAASFLFCIGVLHRFLFFKVSLLKKSLLSWLGLNYTILTNCSCTLRYTFIQWTLTDACSSPSQCDGCWAVRWLGFGTESSSCGGYFLPQDLSLCQKKTCLIFLES